MKDNMDHIYKTYFNDIYRFLLSLSHNHHTAEDLVQDTFFRAYLYMESNDGGNIKSWLFTVAHNVFIDYYRKQKRAIVKEPNFFSFIFDKKSTPDDAVVIQEEIQEIFHLLKDLPKKHKTAILLYDFHDFSYKEAAEIMNVSLAHFKVLLFRGRQAIRSRKDG